VDQEASRPSERSPVAQGYPQVSNSSALQAKDEVAWAGEGVTAGTSIERFGQGDRQTLSHRGDRVLNVSFGTQRRRVRIENGGEPEVFRLAGDRGGEKPIFRGSGIRKPRCRGWRGGGILASLALRNEQGPVRSSILRSRS
jgi:hypothetical protein